MPPKPAAKTAAKAPAAKTATPAAKPAAKAAAPAAKAAAKAPAAKTAAAPAAKAAAPKVAAPAGAGNGVYVKGLGDANVEAVKAIFSAAGNVTSVRLRRNKFALVFFETQAGVKKAVDAFNNKEVKGKTLTVSSAKAAQKSDAHVGTATVFVAPLFRQNTTRSQIRGIFAGAGKILKLRTYRGNYAFVTFDSTASAQKAISEKNGTTFRNKKLLVKASVRK